MTGGAMGGYTVRAKRWARGWELHVDGVGVTQSRTLIDAERQVRDYLSLMLDVDGHALDVSIEPELDRDTAAQIEEARQAVADLAEVQRAAATKSRAAARRLRDAGLSGREIALILHVSPQRVSQLLAA